MRCVVVGQAASRILAGLERATGPPLDRDEREDPGGVTEQVRGAGGSAAAAGGGGGALERLAWPDAGPGKAVEALRMGSKRR
jgi:hypothetical protein